MEDFIDVDFSDGDDRAPIDPQSEPIVRLLVLLVREASELNASRIVLAPGPREAPVLLEIDGEFVERDALPLRVHHALAAHIRQTDTTVEATSPLAKWDANFESTGFGERVTFARRLRGERVKT